MAIARFLLDSHAGFSLRVNRHAGSPHLQIVLAARVELGMRAEAEQRLPSVIERLSRRAASTNFSAALSLQKRWLGTGAAT